jgi:hypothetical protein
MDAGPWGGGRKRSFGDRGIPKCNLGMRAERDPNETQTEVLGRAGIRQSRIPREIRRATTFAINYWSGLLTSGLLHRSHQARVVSRISSSISKLHGLRGHWRETCYLLFALKTSSCLGRACGLCLEGVGPLKNERRRV